MQNKNDGRGPGVVVMVTMVVAAAAVVMIDQSLCAKQPHFQRHLTPGKTLPGERRST